MAIRHLKHKYLIKEQFLEENELITLDFSFSKNFKFLVSFIGTSFVWIYSNIPNAWWKDHNSFSIFLFRLGTLIVGGYWLDGNLYCFWHGFFGPKWFVLPESREKSMNQIGLTWGNGKSGFWVMCPWMSIWNEKGNLV